MAKIRMPTGTCGASIVVFGVVVVVAVVWLGHISHDPPQIAIVVEGPSRVVVGREFTMPIVVRNQRETRAFELTDIDIADEYFNAFILVGTNPPSKSDMHVPIDNTRSFSFDKEVPPQSEMRFEFTWRPTAPGIVRGDVDVCEGTRFLSALLQAEVVAE